MRSNWLFVESPLQLINAFEAINYFSKDSDKNTLVIRKLNCPFVNGQIQRVLENYDLSRINIIFLGCLVPRLYFLGLVSLMVKIALSKGQKRFLIGEFNAFWMRIIPFTFSGSRFILFDDGSMSIALHNYRYDFSKYRASSKWKQFVKAPFFRVLFRGIDTISLFTMYDFKSLPGQKIFRNDFALIQKKNTVGFSNDKIVYFIGSNFVETDEIGKDDYLKLLSKIFKLYIDKNKTIKYMAHRREELEKFDELKNDFRGKLEIIRPDAPLEIYFLGKNEKPENIVGLGSTALYTLAKMYNPKEVVSYRIPSAILHSKIHEFWSVIADYYENSPEVEYRDL